DTVEGQSKDSGHLEGGGEKADPGNRRDPDHQLADGRAVGDGISRVRTAQSRGAKILASKTVLDEAQDHADAGGAEAQVPVDFLSEKSAHEWAEHRADVAPRVEDGETGSAARAPLGAWLRY